MPVGNSELPVADHHRRLYFFGAGERKVICRVQTFRLPALKYEVQAAQKSSDRPLTCKAVSNCFRRFIGKAALNVVLGVRARNNIDRLHFLLQRLQDVVQEFLAIIEKWRDHFFAGGADGQPVRCFLVRAK